MNPTWRKHTIFLSGVRGATIPPRIVVVRDNVLRCHERFWLRCENPMKRVNRQYVRRAGVRHATIAQRILHLQYIVLYLWYRNYVSRILLVQNILAINPTWIEHAIFWAMCYVYMFQTMYMHRWHRNDDDIPRRMVHIAMPYVRIQRISLF